ncbi:MAG: hypothetical protein R2911_19410 [Caldilineaceae bacterium]
MFAQAPQSDGGLSDPAFVHLEPGGQPRLQAAAAAAGAVDAGFRTFSFGATCNSTPTGEKPESKLWIRRFLVGQPV